MSKRLHTEIGVPSLSLSRPAKRSATSGPTQGLSASSSVANIRTAIWETVRQRMACREIPLTEVDIRQHGAVVPLTDDDQIKLLYLKLLDTLLLLSDDELCQLFELSTLSAASVADASMRQKFYLRSCTLTAGQLRTVITVWRRDYLNFEEADIWDDYLKDPKIHGDTPLAIRYVGIAGSGKTGYHRFQEDLRYRKNGILLAFCNTVAVELPAVHVSWKVFEFKSAAVPKTEMPLGQDQFFIDTREMLCTPLFKRFAKIQQTGPDPTMDFDIEAWAEAMKTFADHFKQETRTDRYPLGVSWLERIIAEATPKSFSTGTSDGSCEVLFALVGKDITVEDFVDSKPFFASRSGAGASNYNSRSAVVVINILSQLHALENGFGESLPMPFQPVIFPFVDLYPWIGHKKTAEMIEFLRQYFSITRPWIGIGLGHKVSSSMKGNFMHQYGMTRDRYIDYVGMPSVQYYDSSWLNSENDDEPDPNTAFILIPHIHPGRDKYGNQPESLRRVLFLTWMVTIALADMLLGKLTERQLDSKGVQIGPRDRASICRELLAEAGASAPVARLGKFPSTWKFGYPDLRIGFDGSEGDKEKWMKWANGVWEGKSFFASLIATTDFDKAKPELMTLLPGENLGDPDVRKAVFEKLERNIRLRGSDPEIVNSRRIVTLYWMDNGTKVKIPLRAPPSSVKDEGDRFIRFVDAGISLCGPNGQVFLPARTPFTVTWPTSELGLLVNANNIKRCWERQTSKPWPQSLTSSGPPIPSPSQVPPTSLTAGIFPDVSSSPTPLTNPSLAPSSSKDPASLSAASSSSLSLPASFYGAKGKGPLKVGMSKASIAQYSKPPLAGDATWIMNEFLDEVFPDGGKVFSATVGAWPEKDGEHIRLLFSEFLHRSRYQSYPYRSEWVDILNDSRQASTNTLKKTLDFCRPITRTQKVQKNMRSSGGSQLTGQYWHFGGSPAS
ncbi:hypothetical protein K440DRAFT_662751 [Wilcoxina mikolae CBS 423.85]|nr:hypothetical protein K440DRAFT_662751 [Wilcoxina mikolae CBS 423.85]